jgi:hypothetical protein
MARVAEHFGRAAYPMWDNTRYFCAGMRVTGFADPVEGDALVFQALVTGHASWDLRREVWRIGGSYERAMAPVEDFCILDEESIFDGRFSCALTGVRYDEKKKKYIVPEGGPRTTARVPGIGKEVPIAVDTTGMEEMGEKVKPTFENVGGPEVVLLVRLSQDHRKQLFHDDAKLARVAKLSKDAVPLFSFDGFDLPLGADPPTKSMDLVVMVEALRQRKRLTELPSGGHALSGIYDRIVVSGIGGWGDAGYLGR